MENLHKLKKIGQKALISRIGMCASHRIRFFSCKVYQTLSRLNLHFLVMLLYSNRFGLRLSFSFFEHCYEIKELGTNLALIKMHNETAICEPGAAVKGYLAMDGSAERNKQNADSV